MDAGFELGAAASYSVRLPLPHPTITDLDQAVSAHQTNPRSALRLPLQSPARVPMRFEVAQPTPSRRELYGFGTSFVRVLDNRHPGYKVDRRCVQKTYLGRGPTFAAHSFPQPLHVRSERNSTNGKRGFVMSRRSVLTLVPFCLLHSPLAGARVPP